MKKGIDVSVHNGTVDWSVASKEIDFAMIRGGYGQNHLDKKAGENIRGCIENGVPYGLYWFSYALTLEQVKREAEYLCKLADMFKTRATYPLAFDWEYDSDNNARKNGVKIDNTLRYDFAMTFLKIVQEHGYKPILYSNIDYLDKGFRAVTNKFELWLAQWNVNQPKIPCAMWQTTDKGHVAGISGCVDLNFCYTEYNEERKKTLHEDVEDYITKTYIPLSTDIIDGKYGNGEVRKSAIKNAGLDYKLAQIIVNHRLNI